MFTGSLPVVFFMFHVEQNICGCAAWWLLRAYFLAAKVNVQAPNSSVYCFFPIPRGVLAAVRCVVSVGSSLGGLASKLLSWPVPL